MSPVPAILALDQGTTGSTAIVLARDGRILGRAYSEFTQHFPEPGWVEHDATEIWNVTRRVAREAAARAGSEASLEGVGITNQRETVVVWDRNTLEPVHRAIVWQDRRTTGICRRFREEGHEPDIRDRTGLVLDPYFTATKLTWLFEERPELRERAEAGDLAVGTVDAWLVAKLTDGTVHATDHTNASRTLLYDLHLEDWAPELLDLFGVPGAALPEIRESSGYFGTTDGEAFGLELPVAGIAGDQQAALFGQGCWRRGLAKNTYGTGAFLLLHTGDETVPSEHGLVTTVACDEEGAPARALEASIFVAGAAVQWLRDGLGLISEAGESEALARAVDGNDGVYFVPAFVGLGAPHWEPDARGTIVGLTRGTKQGHLARAALEAMAYSTADALRAMEADSGIRTRELGVDGGGSNNDWLMNFQADITDVPVRRPAIVETTALGAAGLAGLARGVWADGDAFLASREAPTRFEPEMDAPERERLLEGWHRAIRTARYWAKEGA